AATGFNFTPESLAKLGTKITHLARNYNIRNGRKHTDDVLPARFYDEESISGLMAGKKIDREFFKSIIQEYYRLRGWNNEGIPTNETLQKYEI
ncbi:MAG: aldehyde ferredoxin oxidoreductase, partial [Candidatus Cloacimonetes bacterium]|nr:aldehyde ferredoxin oxidoreductase [Candidatus Cloacimonadota bacterium]